MQDRTRTSRLFLYCETSYDLWDIRSCFWFILVFVCLYYGIVFPLRAVLYLLLFLYFSQLYQPLRCVSALSQFSIFKVLQTGGVAPLYHTGGL